MSTDPILDRETVGAMVGLSGATISSMTVRGDFPPAIQISPHRYGWRKSAVNDWINGRPVASLGTQKAVAREIARAVAAEREACAKIADEMRGPIFEHDATGDARREALNGSAIAAAIRKRGEK